MKLFFILFLFILSLNIFAVEMVIVKTVSETQKSFVINKGRPDGITVGTQAVFTTKNYSLVAKATQANQNYSLWKIQTEGAVVPFERDQIVMLNASTETIWALKPDGMKVEFDRDIVKSTSTGWLFRTSFARGLSQSVSDSPADESSRTGYQFDALYEIRIGEEFAFGGGIRLEQENTAVIGAEYATRRYMALIDATYYFPKIVSMDDLKLYVGVTYGYGLSSTTLESYTQSGVATVFPSLRIGGSLPLTHKWEILPEIGFESLSSLEKNADGFEQSLTQTTVKGTIGLRYKL